MNAPLTDLKIINNRLLITKFFYENPNLSIQLKEILKLCPDFERALSRLAFYKNSFQDLITLKEGIKTSLRIKKFFNEKSKNLTYPIKLNEILNSFSDYKKIDNILDNALSEKSYQIGDQLSQINYGYSAELDQLRDILLKSENHISDLESSLIKETKISSLKIKKNNVLGYLLK